MSEKIDFEQIKKDTPEFRDRMEIGLRMLVKLMSEEKNEHILVVCFHLDNEVNQGAIDSVVHTSPGNADIILTEALRFYTEHQAEAHEEPILEE